MSTVTKLTAIPGGRGTVTGDELMRRAVDVIREDLDKVDPEDPCYYPLRQMAILWPRRR